MKPVSVSTWPPRGPCLLSRFCLTLCLDRPNVGPVVLYVGICALLLGRPGVRRRGRAGTCTGRRRYCPRLMSPNEVVPGPKVQKVGRGGGKGREGTDARDKDTRETHGRRLITPTFSRTSLDQQLASLKSRGLRHAVTKRPVPLAPQARVPPAGPACH